MNSISELQLKFLYFFTCGKDKLIYGIHIYTYIGTLETALSIYILANAQIANCPLAFKPTECNKGNKNNANNCNCNPFIVHCQHALIKNASTFADWLPHPVSFLDNVYYLVWATSEKWKNGKLQADNFQFTVNSRQTWRIRYCKNTENGVCLMKQCLLKFDLYIYIYIYAYVYVGVSVSVTLSLSLSLSDSQKKLRIYIASICHLFVGPLLITFGRWFDCSLFSVCLSDQLSWLSSVYQHCS